MRSCGVNGEDSHHGIIPALNGPQWPSYHRRGTLHMSCDCLLCVMRAVAYHVVLGVVWCGVVWKC